MPMSEHEAREQELLGEIEQLRGNLSLAEEGLANYHREALSLHEQIAVLQGERDRLRTAIERAHAELDDILEDWQLEGRHGQPRYERLKRETQAAEDAFRGSVPQT